MRPLRLRLHDFASYHDLDLDLSGVVRLDSSAGSCYSEDAKGRGSRDAFFVASIVRPRTTATLSKSAALGSGPHSLGVAMAKDYGTCTVCGGPLRRGRTAYCSFQCMSKGYLARGAAQRKPCSQCGAGGKTTRGLCVNCYARWRRAQNPEEERAAQRARRHANPDRERKRSRQDSDRKFFNGTKAAILAEKGARCVDCGATSADRTGKALHLHHDDHTGLGTVGDPSLVNNAPENLIPLCSSCHLKRHQAEKGNGRPVTVACAYCGKAIQDLAHRRRRYCDHSCAMRARHRNRRPACSA